MRRWNVNPNIRTNRQRRTSTDYYTPSKVPKGYWRRLKHRTRSDFLPMESLSDQHKASSGELPRKLSMIRREGTCTAFNYRQISAIRSMIGSSRFELIMWCGTTRSRSPKRTSPADIRSARESLLMHKVPSIGKEGLLDRSKVLLVRI